MNLNQPYFGLNNTNNDLIDVSFYMTQPLKIKTIEKDISIEDGNNLIELFKNYQTNPSENTELFNFLIKINLISNDVSLDLYRQFTFSMNSSGSIS